MTKKKTKKSVIKTKKQIVKYNSDNSDKETVVWLFDNVDKSGDYAFDLNRINDDDNLKEIFDKMLSYSTMTWSQVKQQTHDNGKSKHHALDIDGLSGKAKERILAKKLEEYTDSIFSFALTNTLRIIGIRENRLFHVMWYDPQHKFYPSHKKHT